MKRRLQNSPDQTWVRILCPSRWFPGLCLFLGLCLLVATPSPGYDGELRWEPSPDVVDGYLVYYGTSVYSIATHDVGNRTFCALDELEIIPGSTCYFLVTAYLGGAESDASNLVSSYFPGEDGQSTTTTILDQNETTTTTSAASGPDTSTTTTSVAPAPPPSDNGSIGSDSDGDGIDDAIDICPGVYNPEQVDTDGDGIGDDCQVEPSSTTTTAVSTSTGGGGGYVSAPSDPGIDLTAAPSVLEFQPGDTARAFTLTTETGSDVDWKISTIYYTDGKGWISSLSPESGTVAQDSPAQCLVAVDPAEMAPGLYEAKITFSGDDETVSGRVLLHVAPPPVTEDGEGFSLERECDDDLFCNGVAYCRNGMCLAGSLPCGPDEVCDEGSDRCLPARRLVPVRMPGSFRRPAITRTRQARVLLFSTAPMHFAPDAGTLDLSGPESDARGVAVSGVRIAGHVALVELSIARFASPGQWHLSLQSTVEDFEAQQYFEIISVPFRVR